MMPARPMCIHRTARLTDGLEARERPDAGRIVVVQLLMAEQPCRCMATDLTPTSRPIQGRLANLVPLTTGEKPVKTFTPQRRRDQFDFELHAARRIGG
jgi:hypothetical protein